MGHQEQHQQEEQVRGSPTQHGMLLMAIVEAVPMDQLLSDGASIIRTMQVFLSGHARDLTEAAVSGTRAPVGPADDAGGGVGATEGGDGGGDDSSAETKPMAVVLSILSGVLGMGNMRRPDTEEAALRTCLAPLETISRDSRVTDDAEAASRYIYTHSPPPPLILTLTLTLTLTLSHTPSAWR